MASSINASTSGAGGVITTADNTGILQLQTAGVTAVTVNASSALGVGTSPSYGTSGQVLTSAGTGAAPTWSTISSGGMTLLGTITVTAANSVSLGSLSLTGYKQLNIVMNGIKANVQSNVCVSGDNTNTLGQIGFLRTTDTSSGICLIDLGLGSFGSWNGTDTANNASYSGGKCNVTTSTTTLYFRMESTNSFTANGTIKVYGVS
jgi:hypothetical protein